jgi:formylglycine-generating enzyme required for sulfatase activity
VSRHGGVLDQHLLLRRRWRLGAQSGWVRKEAGIGRERGVLAPVALERPSTIAFDDDWRAFQIEDLSDWLTAPPPDTGTDWLDRVGEHGALSYPAFMRLLDRLGEPSLLNRPGLADLSGVYAAIAAAGDPEFTRQRAALETVVRLGRKWLLDFQDDPGAESLARTLVDFEYAALGAQVTQDYGRLLGNWTPPGAEAMRRERGLERNVEKLERALGGKDAQIDLLKATVARLEAKVPQEPDLFGRRRPAPDVRLALEAADAAAREAEKTDINRAGTIWRDTIKGLAPDALPEMVTLPAGRFLMGGARKEEGVFPNEFPQHEVRIHHVFALGRYAVTFAEWDAARQAGAKLENPADMVWGRDRRPVINVSWNDAVAYLDWLNTELGLAGRSNAYRLPSEAEWEYACRAGTTSSFSSGTTITKAQAQFSEGALGSAKQTVPVGSFPANAFGLHEMHGNVWEWCADYWHDTYKGAPANGSEWLSGGSSQRVLRGGSWNGIPSWLRSAGRFRGSPTIRSSSIGFRLAKTVFTP